jgi:hypothetical protein
MLLLLLLLLTPNQGGTWSEISLPGCIEKAR